jgi:O-acetyl-ADP-ribose deacetylase (regulator of RNase III)
VPAPARLARQRTGYGAGSGNDGREPADPLGHPYLGPVYSLTDDRSGLLASCYRQALWVADELGAATVAFPVISTGIYRWPLASAASSAVAAVATTTTKVTKVTKVRFVLYTPEALAVFEHALESATTRPPTQL